MADAPDGLGEFGRIARYLRPLAAGFPGALDLADDAALIDPPAGRSLVVTTDTLVAGVHFLESDTPADLAAKALRVNLSDLAAMGAAPLAYTLDLALPARCDDAWVEAFAAALAAEQAAFGLHLAGGDSVATPGPITVTLTAFGHVPAGGGLRRAGAGPDQDIWVSGSIGDGALGLLAAQGRLASAEAAWLAGRYRRPEPRLALGAALLDVATAALDVSDGLIADMGHVAEASGIAAEIEAPRVPLSGAAAEMLADEPEMFADLLTGGDDYELLFTAPESAREAVEAAGRASETRVTRIGRTRARDADAPAVTARDADGAALAFASTGYRHG